MFVGSAVLQQDYGSLLGSDMACSSGLFTSQTTQITGKASNPTGGEDRGGEERAPTPSFTVY